MIELLLSNDGKRTVHISAKTPQELAELAPKAKALYEKIVASYGNRAQMWKLAIDTEPATLNNARAVPLGSATNTDEVPGCPLHRRQMKLHHGRFGGFWSCKARSEQGAWCRYTVNAPDGTGKPALPT
jgi:hypothetical protein